jgi:hypothetical protein
LHHADAFEIRHASSSEIWIHLFTFSFVQISTHKTNVIFYNLSNIITKQSLRVILFLYCEYSVLNTAIQTICLQLPDWFWNYYYGAVPESKHSSRTVERLITAGSSKPSDCLWSMYRAAWSIQVEYVNFFGNFADVFYPTCYLMLNITLCT